MLSNLVLESESLNRILEGKNVPIKDYFQIFESSQKDGTELFKVAEKLRLENKGKTVTFSKKAFFNIINLCKDTCSYCTYKSEPNDDKISLMSKRNISELLQLSRKYRCVEALFVTGEKPEQKYPEARKWLKDNGFSSTVEFLIDSSEKALKEGLFPHTNAGNLTKDEMKELKKTNVSMGVMLENVSERLSKKGMPHYLASSKSPKARLEVLKNSGRLRIPMTTGILVGIGETPDEIIESLLAIKQLDEEYGNIQEVILQNFHPKTDTIMKDSPSADESYFKTVVAITRLMMPNMNIQIPPNLSPKSYQSFLSIGINDWGGISPLTPDFVNPEFSWPEINKVEEHSNDAGYNLKCRFPVYPEFISMINAELKERINTISDEGFVMESYWR